MSTKVDLSDFVAGFLVEAEEHLHSVNRNLVATSNALKQGHPEPRAIRDLYRSLHTIKGLAAMVGAEPIVDVSHEMESLLRVADRAGGRLTDSILDVLLQGTREVESRVRAIGENGIKNIAPIPPKLLEALALAQNGSVPARDIKEFDLSLPDEIQKNLSNTDRESVIQAVRSGKRVLLIQFQPSPKNTELGLNITNVRERLSQLGDLIKVIPVAAPTAPTGIAFDLLLASNAEDSALQQATGNAQIQVVTAVANPKAFDHPIETSDSPDWLPSEQSSIRVDVRRLDEALEQLSGLFVTRFKLERVAAEMAEQGADIRGLKLIIGETARQLKRLRTAISEARMVPLAELLQRLPLVVRGITKDSDKTVNVNVHAGSAEVDKAVADKIFPAVVHLVRNAVDHAIETREQRRQAGKPEVGEITISCDDSSGTNLILTISDNGKGVDLEAVARKAGRAVAKNEEELLSQICIAGLSTSGSVTHTSGRGMGMEIVKRTIEVLGGSISMQTVAGKGTSITLRVPVTVTIVDVLSFISGGQSFVAPVGVIDEIVEFDPNLVVNLPIPEHKGPQPRLIQYRGKTIPMFILDSLLTGGNDDVIPRKALIINQARHPIAFGIDKMIGKQEAVVRPLDDSLVRVVGMAGATDLGDGKPTLVLDLITLGASVMETQGTLT